MKYCPRCKTRVADTLERCEKCGGAVRRFGAPPASAETSPPPPAPDSQESPASTPATAATSKSPVTDVSPPGEVVSGEVQQLRLQLAGLEHEVARTGRMVYFAGAVVLLLFIGLIAWLYELRAAAIRAYATVEKLAVDAVPNQPLFALVGYRPTSRGKVEIIRKEGDQTETLIEHFDADVDTSLQPRSYTWRGLDRNYTILFRYRQDGRIKESTFGPPPVTTSSPVDLGRGERF
jgi:hypothetical protein